MAMTVKVWKIRGVSPLLQNNPATTMGGSPADEGIKSGKKKYSNEEEARIRLYVNDDGTYYHPAAAFRSALLEASKGRKLDKKAARSIISGAVFPAEERVTILDEKFKPAKKYELHTCRCKVGKAGILRCRPMFGTWSMKLPLLVDDELVRDNIVTDLLNIAGKIIGIGDMRPDTSGGKTGVGTNGRFVAELDS